jgi:ABC-type polysaccharide/polyol phosphate transport system ATPase subunit
MIVRLGFSVATATEPEILLIDECLSAGDMAFQKKASRRMRKMLDHARLIVLVSHDLNALADLCDRGIWMDHGQIVQTGPIQQVIDAYQNYMREVVGSLEPPSAVAA